MKSTAAATVVSSALSSFVTTVSSMAMGVVNWLSSIRDKTTGNRFSTTISAGRNKLDITGSLVHSHKIPYPQMIS